MGSGDKLVASKLFLGNILTKKKKINEKKVKRFLKRKERQREKKKSIKLFVIFVSKNQILMHETQKITTSFL